MNRRTLILASVAFARPALAGLKPDTSVRLLYGGANSAALAIEIGDGWKTYWRMPGDAGIPPDFDWSGSVNAKSIEVLFPAPTRFNDAAGESIGYKSHVVFPLRITPEDPAKPVTLGLKLFFAVCKDICIPSNADITRVLGDADAGAAEAIAAALAAVPKPGNLIQSVRAVEIGGKAALEVVLAGAADASVDIFVEAAEPAYVRAPVFRDGRYVLVASGVKDYATLRGRSLRFTITGANILLEQTVIVA